MCLQIFPRLAPCAIPPHPGLSPQGRGGDQEQGKGLGRGEVSGVHILGYENVDFSVVSLLDTVPVPRLSRADAESHVHGSGVTGPHRGRE